MFQRIATWWNRVRLEMREELALEREYRARREELWKRQKDRRNGL